MSERLLSVFFISRNDFFRRANCLVRSYTAVTIQTLRSELNITLHLSLKVRQQRLQPFEQSKNFRQIGRRCSRGRGDWRQDRSQSRNVVVPNLLVNRGSELAGRNAEFFLQRGGAVRVLTERASTVA